MLNCIVKMRRGLATRLVCGFSGGHHDAPVHIDIDHNATWVKFKSVHLFLGIES